MDDNNPARRKNSSSSGGGGGGDGGSVPIIAAIEGRCSGPEEGKQKDLQTRPSMATQTTASCTGSTLLQPLSEIINLPLDQVCVRMEERPIRGGESAGLLFERN